MNDARHVLLTGAYSMTYSGWPEALLFKDDVLNDTGGNLLLR